MKNSPRSAWCALCQATARLQRSHIIPSFVFRWLRDTSVTPYLRASNAPNQRVQDGLTMPLLCRGCEDLFSSYEDAFARKLFRPFHDNDTIAVPYEDWLLKFSVSVSWRILVSTMLRASKPHPNLETHRRRIDLALERWRRFLLGQEADVGPFEQHLFALTSVAAAQGDWPPRMNRFFSRDVGLDVAMGERNAITYAKLPGFIIHGWLSPSTQEWAASRVLRKGTLKPQRRYSTPVFVADYWMDKARVPWMDQLSPRQQDRTDKEVRNNLRRWMASGTRRALNSDLEVFGSRAIDSRDLEDDSDDS